MDAERRVVRARPRNLLIVCTGNVLRSPLTAATLRSILPPERFRVASRGTHAPDGVSVDAVTMQVAAEVGLDLASHASRRLTADDLEDVDLVITHERAHGAHVTDLAPRLALRTIRSRQLARVADLADVSSSATPRDRISALLTARGVAAGDDLDVPDPVRLPAREQRAIARGLIADARRIGRALEG